MWRAVKLLIAKAVMSTSVNGQKVSVCDDWTQAVSRAGQRAIKLHDSLQLVRKNAAHVEELMIWLNDCHTLLTAKDKDSIPDDLTVVEALLKEHTVLHVVTVTECQQDTIIIQVACRQKLRPARNVLEL